MKKQTVLVASRLPGVLRISCITALLFTLGACIPSGDGREPDSGGPDSSAPAIKVFAANDGINGVELWKTDGTADGTVLIKDINPAVGESSYPSGFAEFNSAFYFQANDGVHGRELWKTNGTGQGTLLVKDINTPAGENSYPYGPSGFTVFNGALYFVAYDEINGAELWKTNGTADGTALVKNINTAVGMSSFPSGLTVFNGALYFAANDGVNSVELWKTDGTTDGTALVKNINPATDAGAGSFPSGLTVFNGALYFHAYDGVDGFELWKTDGTPAGTVLVKDINTTGAGSNPIGFIKFNDALYFKANDGVHGQQLWKTDGTADGTVRMSNINSTAGVGSPFYGFTVFNGALYFGASDYAIGYGVWKTDGTPPGTVRVMDNREVSRHPYPYGFIVFNGALYFRNDDSVSNHELWKTDGTTAGTTLVKNINAAVGTISIPPVPAESNPYVFIELNGALYFPADDGVNGKEFWKTDGTEAGTQLLKDLCPGKCAGY